jgi:hypothetical protein
MYDDEPEEIGPRRPLPNPPRCRGIAIGDGNYSGCAYGLWGLDAARGAVRLPIVQWDWDRTGVQK